MKYLFIYIRSVISYLLITSFVFTSALEAVRNTNQKDEWGALTRTRSFPIFDFGKWKGEEQVVPENQKERPASDSEVECYGKGIPLSQMVEVDAPPSHSSQPVETQLSSLEGLPYLALQDYVLSRLDISDLLSMRSVSRPLRNHVNTALKTLAKRSLLEQVPFFRNSQGHFCPPYLIELERAIHESPYLIFNRNSPFVAFLESGPFQYDMIKRHASSFSLPLSPDDPFEAIIYEDLKDFFVYLPYSMTRKMFQERHKGALEGYIKEQRLKRRYLRLSEISGPLDERAAENVRVVLQQSDLAPPQNVRTLLNFVTRFPKATLILDIERNNFDLGDYTDLIQKASRWVLTSRKRQTSLNDSFLYSFLEFRTLPEGFQLTLPHNLTSISRGFLQGAILPKGLKLIIQESVVSIGRRFLCMAKLPKGFQLTLPESLTSIKPCFLFKAILPEGFRLVIPKGVTSFGHSFLNKASIGPDFKLVISEGVTSIGDSFLCETYISKGFQLTFPQSLTSITTCFLCHAILPEGFRLVIPKGVTSFGHGFLTDATIGSAFQLVISEGVTSIDPSFLSSTKISKGFELTLPQSLTSIDRNFLDHATLPEGFQLVIPEGVTTIGHSFLIRAKLSHGFKLTVPQVHTSFVIQSLNNTTLPEGCVLTEALSDDGTKTIFKVEG